MWIVDFAANYLREQSAQNPILDQIRMQPDGMDGNPEHEFGEQMEDIVSESSSAVPQPDIFMDEINEDDETASDSSGNDDLSAPSDSEEESYFDSTQQVEMFRNTSNSFADHRPSKLQGLSTTDIAKPKWLAESFLIGECANGIKACSRVSWRICDAQHGTH